VDRSEAEQGAVMTATPPPAEVEKDEERQDAVIDEGMN
jgi:hypothetical protein